MGFSRRTPLTSLAIVAGWTALAACEQVLVIEEAEVDPSLEAGGAGGDLGSAGASGFGSTNGVGGSDSPGSGGSAGTEDAGTGGDGVGGNGSAGSSGTPGTGGASGTGSTSGGGTAGTAMDAGPDAEPTLCDRYCAAVMKNCVGGFAVYTELATCLAVCESFPIGNPGDQSGNSVHCRLRTAEIAPSEVPYYCPAAGPGGNGVCGTNCSGFCSVVQGVCTGADQQFADASACTQACTPLEDLGSYTVDLGAQLYKGKHVQCRLYHVSAASIAPAEHCIHAGGEPPCR